MNKKQISSGEKLEIHVMAFVIILTCSVEILFLSNALHWYVRMIHLYLFITFRNYLCDCIQGNVVY